MSMRRGGRGSDWSGRGDLNPRPPEPHLRLCLGTSADISFRQQFTSVWTCPHMCENTRIRRALDARAVGIVWRPGFNEMAELESFHLSGRESGVPVPPYDRAQSCQID